MNTNLRIHSGKLQWTLDAEAAVSGGPAGKTGARPTGRRSADWPFAVTPQCTRQSANGNEASPWRGKALPVPDRRASGLKPCATTGGRLHAFGRSPGAILPPPAIVLAALLCVLAATLLPGCGKAGRAPERWVVRYVVAQPAEQSRAVSRAEYVGLLRGDVETDLSFKVDGQLERIRRQGDRQDWQEGAAIEKGELLAQLQQQDFESAVSDALARRNLAATNHQRIAELHLNRTVSPQELDVAFANLRSAQAALDRAEQARADSTMHAPYRGVVLARLANAGETILRGRPVLRIADLSQVSVELGVPDTLIGRVTNGLTVPVRVAALDGLTFTGRVSEVGVAAKEGTRLFRTVLKAPNPDGRLKAGMSATVDFAALRPLPEGAVLVPLSALVARAGPGGPPRVAVFVVGDDGLAHEREVATGDIVRSSVLVFNLPAGARVVMQGASLLHDGAPVDARPAEAF